MNENNQPINPIYTEQFLKDLNAVADKYKLTRIKIETPQAKQEYLWVTYTATPRLVLERNKVVARVSNRYWAVDLDPGDDPVQIHDKAMKSLREEIAKYNKVYRQKHKAKLNEIQKMKKRELRREQKEKREEVDRRG